MTHEPSTTDRIDHISVASSHPPLQHSSYPQQRTTRLMSAKTYETKEFGARIMLGVWKEFGQTIESKVH